MCYILPVVEGLNKCIHTHYPQIHTPTIAIHTCAHSAYTYIHSTHERKALSAGAVEYTDCIVAEDEDLRPHGCLGYDIKQFDGDGSALENWGIWRIPSLPLLPGPLCPAVSDRILSMGQKEQTLCKQMNRLIGLMGRVFVNGPGDLGSIRGRAIPKTLKMLLDISWLSTQQYKVRIKGKVEESWERRIPWCSSYGKGSVLVTLDYGHQL